ncbi:MAG: hypothetical protein KGJ07_06285 [Patescibacteria group bacterium]|nr:hypothetical protein [Patescibacteria group bacterium]MDE2589184.1 hypothetical protein [Patescibacteria group bacterium]
MKRIVFVLLFLLFFTIAMPSLAQEVVPTPTPVDYTLAYPGILPDNPLYKIKAFRDWLISILIADSLKKAEFDILQADKRLGAAQDLFEENPPKAALAVETLSKGENYFFSAIAQMKQAKIQGESLYDTLQKLRLSNAKHLEIVLQLEQGQTGNILKGLRQQEQRIRGFGKTVVAEGAH